MRSLNRSDCVHAAEVRRVRLVLQARYHRRHKVRPKPAKKEKGCAHAEGARESDQRWVNAQSQTSDEICTKAWYVTCLKNGGTGRKTVAPVRNKKVPEAAAADACPGFLLT